MSEMTLIPITSIGYDRLKEELKRLKSVDRPKVIEEIAEARALGDLSENAEYHSAREKQAFIEGRILELDDKLARVQVVEPPPGQTTASTVVFGTQVVLVDVTEEEGGSPKAEKKAYRIVGELEANLKNNEISIASPLAQSLVNKAVGEVVVVALPKGEKYYEIQSISYL